jgi:hypothetical protein
MPTPTYRVPVRVARGTLAALTAGLSDLQEGELCYATDEDTLYVVEGGVLTATGSTASGDLVDDTTPQLGGDLDVNSFQIISTAAGNIQIAPDTTGVLEVRGNTGNDAAIQLNCETNGHGVKIQSPPHSAAASYTLVLPGDTGTTGQALTTDGAGVLSWATPSTVGSIDDLADVDTSSVAPTDGQVLVWSNADSEWQPGDSISEVVSDTTPQLGGNLDVNGSYITSSAGGNIEVGPDTTGDFIVRGNNTDGSITLNCTANTHGVKIQSPPHSAAASYTLVLPEDTGTTGQALTTNGSGVLSWATPSTVGSIDDLSDVDTTAVAPTDGQALVWDNANSEWVPGNVAADIGTTSIDALSDVDTTTAAPTNDQVLAWNGANWVPADAATGNGGGGSSAARLTEAQTAASGIATFAGIGHSGTLVEVTSSLDAWIVLYDSASSRTADNGRAYNTDPASGSGVLAEFYITAGTTVLATPGTTYFNNDTSVTEAVYAAVRDQAGSDVDSVVTIIAYGNQSITSVSGGTFGSGI